MLTGPCACTIAGAATVAAAPAAATFRKRRRVEVLSLVVMVFLPFGYQSLVDQPLIYWPRDKCLRGYLASVFLMAARHATPGRGLRRKSVWRSSAFIPGRTEIFIERGRILRRR